LNDVFAPQYNVRCIGIASSKELHIIPTAVVNNFFNFFDRNGSSESQGMYAEVRISCLLFPHLVIPTIATSVEQSCDWKGMVCVADKKVGSWNNTSSSRTLCPLYCVIPFFSPHKPRVPE